MYNYVYLFRYYLLSAYIKTYIFVYSYLYINYYMLIYNPICIIMYKIFIS